MSKKSYKFKKYYPSSEEEKIPPHKHCICGKMIPPDQEYCSEACRLIAENKKKSEKKKMRVMFIAFGAIIGVTLVIFIFLGKMA
ncbi:MAG: DUF2116 family Zn-ribbon domain-containing protein [Promethearchaeota archaeon]